MDKTGQVFPCDSSSPASGTPRTRVSRKPPHCTPGPPTVGSACTSASRNVAWSCSSPLSPS